MRRSNMVLWNGRDRSPREDVKARERVSATVSAVPWEHGRCLSPVMRNGLATSSASGETVFARGAP